MKKTSDSSKIEDDPNKVKNGSSKVGGEELLNKLPNKTGVVIATTLGDLIWRALWIKIKAFIWGLLIGIIIGMGIMISGIPG